MSVRRIMSIASLLGPRGPVTRALKKAAAAAPPPPPPPPRVTKPKVKAIEQRALGRAAAKLVSQLGTFVINENTRLRVCIGNQIIVRRQDAALPWGIHATPQGDSSLVKIKLPHRPLNDPAQFAANFFQYHVDDVSKEEVLTCTANIVSIDEEATAGLTKQALMQRLVRASTFTFDVLPPAQGKTAKSGKKKVEVFRARPTLIPQEFRQGPVLSAVKRLKTTRLGRVMVRCTFSSNGNPDGWLQQGANGKLVISRLPPSDRLLLSQCCSYPVCGLVIRRVIGLPFRNQPIEAVVAEFRSRENGYIHIDALCVGRVHLAKPAPTPSIPVTKTKEKGVMKAQVVVAPPPPPLVDEEEDLLNGTTVAVKAKKRAPPPPSVAVPVKQQKAVPTPSVAASKKKPQQAAKAAAPQDTDDEEILI